MNWNLLILLLKIAGGLWLFYLWCCFASWAHLPRSSAWDPAEAKSKGVLTALVSLGVIAFAVHWSVAACLFVLAVAAYFKARKFFKRPRADRDR